MVPSIDDELLPADYVNKRILKGGILASSLVVTLTLLVYVTAAPEEIGHLTKNEKEGAKIGFYMMAMSTGAIVLSMIYPLFRKNGNVGSSPILTTALMINVCSLGTNGLLAFAPVVTRIDPVLGIKVYLLRWCEWIPLAGLMRYIADVVPSNRAQGDLPVVRVALLQSLVCFPQLLMPLAPNAIVWSLGLAFSMSLHVYLVPRVWQTYRIGKETVWGNSPQGRERMERHNFGVYLSSVCVVVWNFLVFLYFLNAFSHNFMPRGHWLRHPAINMLMDSTFDVIAKAFYCRLILDIHHSVFHKPKAA